MEFHYDPNEKGVFVYHTGLYTKAASSLISSIKTLCQTGLRMSIRRAANAYVLGDFTEILTDDNGEVVLNGMDTAYYYGKREEMTPINEANLLTLTKRLIKLEFSAENPSAPDFSQESFKVSLLPSASPEAEITIKKKDLFILRDYLEGSSKEELYEKYSKKVIDEFIGKPDNDFVVELKKELKEKIKKLKAVNQKKRDDFEYEINEKRKALTAQLNEFYDSLQIEEDNEINELTTETLKLISANQ